MNTRQAGLCMPAISMCHGPKQMAPYYRITCASCVTNRTIVSIIRVEKHANVLQEVYQLKADRLYATYFGGDAKQGLQPDDEAKNIW